MVIFIGSLVVDNDANLVGTLGDELRMVRNAFTVIGKTPFIGVSYKFDHASDHCYESKFAAMVFVLLERKLNYQLTIPQRAFVTVETRSGFMIV